MIRDGHLNAMLPPPIIGADTKPVLRFLSHNPNQPSIDQDALLKEKSSHIERLAKHVREADRKLAIQKEYVELQAEISVPRLLALKAMKTLWMCGTHLRMATKMRT